MEKSEYFRTAAELHREMGIVSPDEIDIEAIAYHCGATIRYRQLTGCAARIVGAGNKAIITIDVSSPRGRQRFSAGHELGHWMHDRGKASFSCQESQFVREWSATSNPEPRANRYASDLLLPPTLFKPKAETFRTMDFDTVRSLAQIFVTSLTATAIRLVECGPLPTMLVCYSAGQRVWFVRGSLPGQLYPSEAPRPYTYAFDLLRKGMGDEELRGEVPADAWFDHPSAKGHYIEEHSIGRYGDVLSLLWWKNERMLIHLEEYEEKKAARRSDWRED